MNDEIACDIKLAAANPEQAIEFGLLKGGLSAVPFIMKSQQIVESWFNECQYGETEFYC
jgi:hypothetical protein|eukprot:COSAG01_NODE_9101_length_2554_cov_139.263544_3_plen_59_part_00